MLNAQAPAAPALAPRERGVRSRAEQQKAFADAQAHSARVHALRRGLPWVIAALFIVGIFGRLLNPFRVVPPDVQISTTGLQGTKVLMEQLKVSGFRKDNKAYEVVSDSASQDVKKSNIVEFRLPVARIEMSDAAWARLTASNGVYDATTEKMQVHEKVTVKTDTGFELRLSQADVDFKAGTLDSNEPAELIVPNGWVKSETMKVTDSGKVIVFEGKVRSEFTNADAADGQKNKKATEQ
jgi:lipopolysaccharide export system protein LptC